VAIVVRDRRQRMLRCLDALFAQDHRPFEILVIDNCSVDETAEAVRIRARTAPVPVRVIEMAGSVGRLRNAAVALAVGEVLAFTDSDCAPEPGWLAAGVATLTADGRLGVVQGCTLPDDDRPGPWANTQKITAESFLFECCNIFYRVEAIRGAAAFDEDPRLSAFGEDTAAGWSVLRRGWCSAYEPGAIVRHDVTYPGLPWHLTRALRYEIFPKLAGEYPEMRERLFWRRWFLSRRYAAFLAAALGIGLAPRWRPALLLAAPYAWFRRPRGLTGADVRGQLEGTLYDLAGFAGLVRGSVRYRQVVL
jgi:glycosyltransferase involved in cell wall biosynthesis